MADKPEIYVSVDIETNGPIPGVYSMLSFGAAAFREDGSLYDTFTRNIRPLPNATESADTMAWWNMPENRAAYQAATYEPENPDPAMHAFHTWLKNLPGKPVFIGYPAGFDFLFIYWYLIYFTGSSPFSFSALDIKTYAAAMLKLPYRQATKRNMPKRWFCKYPHTHVAIDDAIEQGELFMAMRKENLNG
jgi:hypothetical protein